MNSLAGGGMGPLRKFKWLREYLESSYNNINRDGAFVTDDKVC